MFKLIEVSQKVTFDVNSNTSALVVAVPWTTILGVAILGPTLLAWMRPAKAQVATAVKTNLGVVDRPATETQQADI